MATSNIRNLTYPDWLPASFQLPSDGSQNCPSATGVLEHFALYNGISILICLTTKNKLAQKMIRFGKPVVDRPWSYWGPVGHLAFQISGIVGSAYLAKGENSGASVGQLIQLWALRPRTTWFIGNMACIRREWGYMNSALSSIFSEVIICSLACVFVAQVVGTAVLHSADGSTTWYRVILGASITMLISTGFEILWAAYLLFRMFRMKARPEADDIDALRWIARTFVPITCLCSWLIWAAFLYSTETSYCPSNGSWIDVVWGCLPVLSNLYLLLSETYF
jgi:hypothetical protein